MSNINLRDKDYADVRAMLERRLVRYGLKLKVSELWTRHGPHYPDMPYPVYIGTVIDGKSQYTVAVYPKAVYIIPYEDDWRKVGSDNRIYQEQSTRRKQGNPSLAILKIPKDSKDRERYLRVSAPDLKLLINRKAPTE